jgi:protease-4
LNKRSAATLLVLFGGLFLLFLVFMAILSVALGGVGPRGGIAVGVVELKGVIHDSRKVSEQLWEMAEGDAPALVLRIDSPGGSVGPSQEIYEEVLRIRKETGKPVVASMGAVAASGGYYAAIACDRIVANPGTITGSVGVIMQTASAEEWVDLARLDIEVFKSGALKDSGSPVRELSVADRSLFQGMIKDIFEQFHGAVRERRELSDEAAATVADGRVLSGRQAKELGLVDKLGNLGSAARLALELAGVEGTPRLVYPREDVPDWVRKLIRTGAQAVADGVEAVPSVKIGYQAPFGRH